MTTQSDQTQSQGADAKPTLTAGQDSSPASAGETLTEAQIVAREEARWKGHYGAEVKKLTTKHTADYATATAEARKYKKQYEAIQSSDELRSSITDATSLAQEHAEMWREKYGYPAIFDDDVMSRYLKGGRPEAKKYAESLADIFKQAQPAAPEAPANVTQIIETAATERTMPTSGARSTTPQITKDNADKLWLDGQISDADYRKFLKTG